MFFDFFLFFKVIHSCLVPFLDKQNGIKCCIYKKVNLGVLKANYDDICEAWKKVDAKHDCYVDSRGELANDVECDNDMWIKEIQDSGGGGGGVTGIES